MVTSRRPRVPKATGPVVVRVLWSFGYRFADANSTFAGYFFLGEWGRRPVVYSSVLFARLDRDTGEKPTGPIVSDDDSP